MMGWEVAVLTDAFTHQWAAKSKPLQTEQQQHIDHWTAISAEQLNNAQASATHCLDIRASTKYREAHLKNFIWSIRPKLNTLSSLKGASVVLVADDLALAELAALELSEAGASQIQINMSTVEQWRAAGLELTSSPSNPTDQDSIDYLFFVHDRHEGNRAAAMRYLEWEINLLNQIDEQERQSYRLPH